MLKERKRFKKKKASIISCKKETATGRLLQMPEKIKVAWREYFEFTEWESGRMKKILMERR